MRTNSFLACALMLCASTIAFSQSDGHKPFRDASVMYPRADSTPQTAPAISSGFRLKAALEPESTTGTNLIA